MWCQKLSGAISALCFEGQKKGGNFLQQSHWWTVELSFEWKCRVDRSTCRYYKRCGAGEARRSRGKTLSHDRPGQDLICLAVMMRWQIKSRGCHA